MKQITVNLDVGNTDELPDYLYDALVCAFYNKLRNMGHDPENFVMDEWTVTAKADPLSNYEEG